MCVDTGVWWPGWISVQRGKRWFRADNMSLCVVRLIFERERERGKTKTRVTVIHERRESFRNRPGRFSRVAGFRWRKHGRRRRNSPDGRADGTGPERTACRRRRRQEKNTGRTARDLGRRERRFFTRARRDRVRRVRRPVGPVPTTERTDE